MKIVLVTTSLECGGAERVTVNLANAWAARGWEVAIVTLTGSDTDFYVLDERIERVALDQVESAGNPVAGLVANLRRLASLRKLLRRLAPDAVIGMATTGAVLCIVASVGAIWPVVAVEQVHPPMLPLSRIWERLRCWTYPRATHLIALTGEGRAWMQKAFPGCRVDVIFNPVALPLPSVPPLLPTSAVMAADRRLLLAVGRLEAQKGFDLLLTAFTALSSRHPQWDLVILGEGPQRETLELQQETLGLRGRAFLPGRAGNVADWYARADLYVMSSRFEGFPNTLVEAMAHGCPAVSYDCETGPRDIVRDGIDGLLVQPIGDVNALAEALSRLMADDALRARMASRVGEAAERFSMQRNLTLWDELLRSVAR
ncbi:MAG: glycosyltransferase family 4 protein [Ectothiorhodospiraceae bacterium]|jgi:glycosyltransferase involved in cell wall biosynthesis|nr:glycosyltransferase family 4 protein [Ectothiorhodospiraceae bacterium]